MAFDVTPTSGDAPYTLTATFVEPQLVDGVLYRAELRSNTQAGACPPAGAGVSNDAAGVASLLSTGVYVTPSETVPAGSCRRITFDIIRVADSVRVSRESVTVSNL